MADAWAAQGLHIRHCFAVVEGVTAFARCATLATWCGVRSIGIGNRSSSMTFDAFSAASRKSTTGSTSPRACFRGKTLWLVMGDSDEQRICPFIRFS
jgi:hypothetical protein